MVCLKRAESHKREMVLLQLVNSLCPEQLHVAMQEPTMIRLLRPPPLNIGKPALYCSISRMKVAVAIIESNHMPTAQAKYARHPRQAGWTSRSTLSAPPNNPAHILTARVDTAPKTECSKPEMDPRRETQPVPLPMILEVPRR